MKNKAVFLDRDGTINVEKDYLYKIEDFEFLPGVIEALRELQDNGFLLIVITNQSGVARGYYKEKDCVKLNNWMVKRLKREGVNISHVYYCPHHPEASIAKYRMNCSCRKPGVKLFEQAVKDYNLDLSRCVAIGDKIRDCAICSETECRGYLINNNEKDEIINRAKAGDYKNVKYAPSMTEAVMDLLNTDIY